jgi:hypothetical protein
MDILDMDPEGCEFFNLDCGSDLSSQGSNPVVVCEFLLHCFVFSPYQLENVGDKIGSSPNSF